MSDSDDTDDTDDLETCTDCGLDVAFGLDENGLCIVCEDYEDEREGRK